MKNLLLTILLASTFTTSAIAAGNPAKNRQLIMKNVGAATGAAVKMLKGEVEFNLVAAQLALRTMNNAALAINHLFPLGTETGEETEASPKIWSDRTGFDAAVAKFVTDTSGKITDEASFKMAFSAATSNCGACHKAYRIKKN
ncbi:MAG: cytochrome C556 [Hyphomicrobiales bacterium]|nr:MAG: cytochrome C556 [Hyphomicrobiales bacterium]